MQSAVMNRKSEGATGDKKKHLPDRIADNNSVSIKQLMSSALQYNQIGRLAEAESCYRNILV